MSIQFEVLKDVASRLELAGIPYMISGSVALNLYAQPRMTRDIDLVVAVEPGMTDEIEKTFGGDYYVSPEALREAVRTKGMFNAIHNGHVVKVDFIIRKDDPYRLLEFSRRRQVEVEGFSLYAVSPEDLILSKLDWARQGGSERQLEDVRTLFACVPDLDRGYLREWAGKLDVSDLLEKASR